MHGSSKPNYIPFVLALVVLMTLIILTIPMRPSNLEYLAEQETIKDSITTIKQDSPKLEPISSLDSFQTLDTLDTNRTILAPIVARDTLDTATVPPTIIVPEEKPTTSQTANNENTVAPKEATETAKALGILILTILIILILAYAIFRIITKRWEYLEEQKLMAKMKLNSPVATTSYNPSDWEFNFGQASYGPSAKSDPAVPKTGEDDNPKDSAQKEQEKNTVTTNNTTATVTKQAQRTMPLWLRDLLFSPFIIAFSIVLGCLSILLRLVSLFADKEATKRRVANITHYIDLYAIDIPSTLTLLLFVWVQYLMFPTFPFHSNWLTGLILLPIVYIPLYTLPALYRIWKRGNGNLGMWATAILWNLILLMTLLIYGLLQLLDGQSGGDSTGLYILLGGIGAAFLGRRWYKKRQQTTIETEEEEEELPQTTEEIKEEVTEAIKEEEETELPIVTKPKPNKFKWAIAILLGAAFLVFVFDDNLLGIDSELNNSLQGGALVLVVMIIAFFASNGNKQTADLPIIWDDEEEEEDQVLVTTEMITATPIKTVQQIDPSIFTEPEWWLKVDLARLGMVDMSNQDLDEDHPFMPYLMDCVNLKTLYLNNNNFEEIPFEVFELDQLKVLEIQGNNIVEIDTDVEFLEKLNILDLSNNQINELPQELGALEQLKLLIINDNPIAKKDIEQFQAAFPKIKIEHNAVEEESTEQISEEEKIKAKELIKIKRLLKKKLNTAHRVTYISELFQQDLSTLPHSILKEFRNLSGIYLVGNQFKEIPAALYPLPKLKNIYLGDNQITEIPDQIIELKELKTLSLSNNPLAKVSMNITKLPKLRQLYLDYTQLKSFPMWVTQIPTLKELSLYGNHIAKLPEEITKLKQLEDLDLGFANMLEMPDFLCTMDSIQVLNWAGNDLEKLPDQFDRLLNLRELNLSHNPNLKLDADILKQFPYLKIVHLGAMGYDLLPQFISSLTFLNALWLNDNKLSNLPYDFDNLVKLKTLSLSRNNFKVLPESIGNLSDLENLYLDNNDLETLPKSIKRLTKLRKLSIRNNNLSINAKRDVQRWLPNTQINF